VLRISTYWSSSSASVRVHLKGVHLPAFLCLLLPVTKTLRVLPELLPLNAMRGGLLLRCCWLALSEPFGGFSRLYQCAVASHVLVVCGRACALTVWQRSTSWQRHTTPRT